jgi:hypothetical protein
MERKLEPINRVCLSPPNQDFPYSGGSTRLQRSFHPKRESTSHHGEKCRLAQSLLSQALPCCFMGASKRLCISSRAISSLWGVAVCNPQESVLLTWYALLSLPLNPAARRLSPRRIERPIGPTPQGAVLLTSVTALRSVTLSSRIAICC